MDVIVLTVVVMGAAAGWVWIDDRVPLHWTMGVYAAGFALLAVEGVLVHKPGVSVLAPRPARGATPRSDRAQLNPRARPSRSVRSYAMTEG